MEYLFLQLTKTKIMNTECSPCIDHPLTTQTKRLTPDEIIDIVCEHFNLQRVKVCGKPRYRYIVETRMIIAYLLRADKYLNLSLNQIGGLLGGRDHSTVMHSVKQIDNLMSVIPEMREKVRGVFMKVYGNLNYYRND